MTVGGVRTEQAAELIVRTHKIMKNISKTEIEQYYFQIWSPYRIENTARGLDLVVCGVYRNGGCLMWRSYKIWLLVFFENLFKKFKFH